MENITSDEFSSKLQRLKGRILNVLHEYSDEWRINIDMDNRQLECIYGGYEPSVIISWEEDWESDDDFLISCDHTGLDMLGDIILKGKYPYINGETQEK